MANYLFTDREFTSTGLKVCAIDPASIVHDEADAIGGGNAYPKENDVLIIDIFLKFKDPEYQHYQELGGIALLKFLRIMGSETSRKHRNHIVLLSPWSLPQLLRMEPGYHILASPGITIAQYTYSLDELKGHDGVALDLNELAKEKALPKEQLREWFRAGISLPKDERHNWANWWGIYALVEFQNAHYPKEYSKHWLLPAPVREKLRQLRNAEVRYVYEELDVRYGRFPQSIEPVKARIVYIDDQANEGWEEILRNSLDEDSRKALRTYVPAAGQLKDKDGITALFEKKPDRERPALKEALKQCDVVLLDLRLDPVNDNEAEKGSEEELSGIRLLRIIRELHPGLPVLMFTASTSAELKERLLDLGVDIVWVKPGLDAMPSTRSALLELTNSLHRLCGLDYQALRTMGDSGALALTDPKGRWWSSQSWDGISFLNDSPSQRAFSEAVVLSCEQVRDILRSITCQAVADNGTMSLHQRMLVANVIWRMGCLVEWVHFGIDADTRIDQTTVFNLRKSGSRGDLLGWAMLMLRNCAAHLGGTGKTSLRHLRLSMSLMAAYVSLNKFSPVSHKNDKIKALNIAFTVFGSSPAGWWRRSAQDIVQARLAWASRSEWFAPEVRQWLSRAAEGDVADDLLQAIATIPRASEIVSGAMRKSKPEGL